VLSTGWGIVVSFLLWVLHPWGKNSWYQLNRRMDEPQAGLEISYLIRPIYNNMITFPRAVS